jgi:hypothetical protein
MQQLISAYLDHAKEPPEEKSNRRCQPFAKKFRRKEKKDVPRSPKLSGQPSTFF